MGNGFFSPHERLSSQRASPRQGLTSNKQQRKKTVQGDRFGSRLVNNEMNQTLRADMTIKSSNQGANIEIKQEQNNKNKTMKVNNPNNLNNLIQVSSISGQNKDL